MTTQLALEQCTITDHIDHLPQPVEPDDTCILKRRHPFEHAGDMKFWYVEHIMFWFSPFTRELIMPDGKYSQMPKDTTLERLLDSIREYAQDRGKKRADLVLVAGTLSTSRPKQSWFEVAHGWQKKLFWKYLSGEYIRDGFTVYLRSTGGYFGEEVKNIRDMYNAWHSLEKVLQDTFRIPGCNILADTPAQTGRGLLLITLPKGIEYFRLPADIREFLHHNFGQGREQAFPPQKEVLGDIFILDGHWFYASCISHLPIGPVHKDKVNKFLGVVRKDGRLAPKCPAFYNVTVAVPDGWHHMGLLKENIKTDGEASFPNEPGYTFTNWAEAHEVALLLDNPQGIPWHVHINERIYWPDTDKIADPFKTLRTKLVELRKNAANEYHKNAIRAILLHLIGSFHRIGTMDEIVTPYDRLDEIEHPYEHRTTLRADGVQWQKIRDFESDYMNSFLHPEWSATIYGRARAKLAEFALHLPFKDVIALRNDAVWSTSSLELGDPDKPGSFREKGIIHGPIPWPNSTQAETLARVRNREKLLSKEE